MTVDIKSLIFQTNALWSCGHNTVWIHHSIRRLFILLQTSPITKVLCQEFLTIRFRTQMKKIRKTIWSRSAIAHPNSRPHSMSGALLSNVGNPQITRCYMMLYVFSLKRGHPEFWCFISSSFSPLQEFLCGAISGHLILVLTWPAWPGRISPKRQKASGCGGSTLQMVVCTSWLTTWRPGTQGGLFCVLSDCGIAMP